MTGIIKKRSRVSYYETRQGLILDIGVGKNYFRQRSAMTES